MNLKKHSMSKLKYAAIVQSLIMLLLVLLKPVHVAAESDFVFYGDMNFDVVFVADASGSMAHADSEHLASEMMRLFIDMCDSRTCRAGCVVYSHVLEAEHELVDLNSSSADELIGCINSIEYKKDSDTDIACGLTEAMNILESAEKLENRNPMIVLLSDGRTDLPKGPRTVEESESELVSTVDSLKQKNIPVYTVGLNMDESLDVATMTEIAEKTNARTFETKSASNLKDIIIQIFADFNNIDPIPVPVQFDEETGSYVITVNIDNESIYCANIVIQSNHGVSNPQITKDALPVVIDNERIIFKQSRTYSLVKLILPQTGVWKITVDGVKEDDVQVTLLRSYSLIAKQELSDNHMGAGGSVNIRAMLSDETGTITDQALINVLTSKTTFTNTSTGETQTLPLEKGEDGTFSGVFSTNSPGTYTVKTIIQASDNSFFKESLEAYLTVEEEWNEKARVKQQVEPTNISVGDSISVSAYLYNEDQPSERINSGGYAAFASVTDESGDEIAKVQLESDDTYVWTGEYKPERFGQYRIKTVITRESDGSVKESMAEAISVSKKNPTAISENGISVKVYSKPASSSERIRLSSYVSWDTDEQISISINPAECDFYSVEQQGTGEDTYLEVTGKKVGSSSSVIEVVDSRGMSCKINLSVEVVSGWKIAWKYLLFGAGLVVLCGCCFLLVRPKFSGGDCVRVSVINSNGNNTPVTKLHLPRKKHKISFSKALSLNINQSARTDLEPVRMILDPVFRKIVFVAHSGRKIKVEIRKSQNITTVGGEIFESSKITTELGSRLHPLTGCTIQTANLNDQSFRIELKVSDGT